MKNHFIDDWCKGLLSRFPTAMTQAKEFIRDRYTFSDSWPSWCGLPMAATYAILTGGVDAHKAPAIMAEIGPQALPDLTAALLWTQTKMVYRYDREFIAEIASSPLTGNIPIDILYRLPYYCIYVEAPVVIFGEESRGFFAWMEYDVNNKMPELRLLYLMRDNYTISVPVLLPGGGLDESNNALYESAMQRSSIDVKSALADLSGKSLAAIKPDITAAINLVLYVCSEDADIRPASRQRVTPTGQTPKQCTAWDVGVRIGSALRKASDAATSSRPVKPRESATTSPRPHMRRAHWHHYWTGPRWGARKLVLKWVHPVLVGSGDGDMPTTVLPIKSGVDKK